MCLSQAVTVIAEPVEAFSEVQHEALIERDFADTNDGTPAVSISMSGGDEVTVKIREDVTVAGDSDGQSYVAGASVEAVGWDTDTENTSKTSTR